ncbi:Uncharacterised protein [uncultured archaeon]|nr:Uncharacterised protein [uncultured archaeon]
MQIENTGNVKFDKRSVLDFEVYDDKNDLIADINDEFAFWELEPSQITYADGFFGGPVEVKCNAIYKVVTDLREEGYPQVYATSTFKLRITNETELRVSKNIEQ